MTGPTAKTRNSVARPVKIDKAAQAVGNQEEGWEETAGEVYGECEF
jgi:hypothetical protein